MGLTIIEMRARRNKVKNLYLAGFSASEIAKQLEIGDWTVLNDLKALEIPRRPQGSHFKPPSIRCTMVAKMHLEEGKSQRKIAEELGISINGVNRYVARYLRNNPDMRKK